MGCGSQGSGTCSTTGSCGSSAACSGKDCHYKLQVFDWLANMKPAAGTEFFPIVEVRFKNSRKDFFHLNNLSVQQGETVTVEAASGHDVGVVSLTGELVKLQMKKRGVEIGSDAVKKIYRKTKEQEIEKWIAARELETPTMHKARTIASSLKLQMKISDVEYQGDKTKATFYYTADERVDFRELIKLLAQEFKVKIEMRQIGARQEAGRLGGIGSCGRELCCSTWLTDFRTVTTTAARYQQLSLNPIKLAGQCGKLKCCLNYELDAYVEVLKDFPDAEIILQTEKGNAKHQKSDIFKRTMWYAYENDYSVFLPLTIENVKEIISLNKKGQKPETLELFSTPKETLTKEPDYENVVGQDSLDRFDKKINQSKKKKRNNKHKNNHEKKEGTPLSTPSTPQNKIPQNTDNKQPRKPHQHKPFNKPNSPKQNPNNHAAE